MPCRCWYWVEEERARQQDYYALLLRAPRPGRHLNALFAAGTRAAAADDDLVDTFCAFALRYAGRRRRRGKAIGMENCMSPLIPAGEIYNGCAEQFYWLPRWAKGEMES